MYSLLDPPVRQLLVVAIEADLIFSEFIASLELLEAIEYHTSTFAPLNWEWVFQTVVPWLATAIVLTYLPHTTRKSDIDRGRKQIEIIFHRYSDPVNPISTCPRWLLLGRLREQMCQTGSQSDAGLGFPTHQGDISSQAMQNSALVFTDDLMLDFSVAAPIDPILIDDLGYQDVQDLPWYVTPITRNFSFNLVLRSLGCRHKCLSEVSCVAWDF